MKVLYAVHAYKPAYRVGGPILSVSAAAERIARQGHEVTVFTSNSNLDEVLDVPLGQPVDVDGVTVYYFKAQEPFKRWFPSIQYLSKSIGFLYSPEIYPALKRLIPKMDVVHTQMPFVYPTLAAARVAISTGVPLFYHQRGVFDPQRLRFRSLKKKLYIQCVEAPIMRRASMLIALTESELGSYRALGIRTRCSIVPNGIDTHVYKCGNSMRARAKWKISEDAIVVLFLGRVHPIKGADKLLEAILMIARRHADLVLVMAGPDEWGVQGKFATAVAEAGMGGRLIFTGMVAGNDKLDLLSTADLFCLPSAGEGFSMAVLEALASQTAVLLSPGCHFPEVESAGAGRVVGTEPKEIGEAVEAMISDRSLLVRMGKLGADFVALNYGWDSIVERLTNLYKEAIRNKQSNGSQHVVC